MASWFRSVSDDDGREPIPVERRSGRDVWEEFEEIVHNTLPEGFSGAEWYSATYAPVLYLASALADARRSGRDQDYFTLYDLLPRIARAVYSGASDVHEGG